MRPEASVIAGKAYDTDNIRFSPSAAMLGQTVIAHPLRFPASAVRR